MPKSLLIVLAIVCVLGVTAYFVFHAVHALPTVVTAKQAEGPVGPPDLTIITALARSHDGHVLATANDNKTIALWDAGNGTNLRALDSSPSEWIFAPAFSPDGALLATASYTQGRNTQGQLLLWNPSTGERLGSVENLSWPKCVSFNAAGTLIAVGGTPTLYLVDPSTREIIHQVDRAHENGAIQEVEFSPSGDLLATAGRDGTVKVWQVPELNLLRTFSVGQSARPTSPIEGTVRVIVGSVAFAHHRPYLAASTSEGSVFVWNLNNGQEIVHHVYDYSTARGDSYIQTTLGNSLSFTPDDRWLLTTTEHGDGVRLLGADSKKQTGALLSTQHTDTPIEALNFSPTDGSLAFAYRIFPPGQKPQTKFEIWTFRLR
jgi:WD40 repeat protein